jgi:hypothetical protein
VKLSGDLDVDGGRRCDVPDGQGHRHSTLLALMCSMRPVRKYRVKGGPPRRSPGAYSRWVMEPRPVVPIPSSSGPADRRSHCGCKRGQLGVSFSRQSPASLFKVRGADARFSLESWHFDGLAPLSRLTLEQDSPGSNPGRALGKSGATSVVPAWFAEHDDIAGQQ